jgi:hypothetical protein
MRVSYALIMVIAAFFTNNAAVMASPELVADSKIIRDSDSKRLLRSEALLEIPERLEDYVENHHLIRHILWWCQEEMAPEEALKAVKPGSEEEEAALIYKNLVAKQRKSGRKLIQCGV